MFSDIEANIYVLVDGDGTYDAAAAPRMIERLIDNNLDLVNGVRRSTAQVYCGPVLRHAAEPTQAANCRSSTAS